VRVAGFVLLCLLGACGQAPAPLSAPVPSPAPTPVVVVPPTGAPLPAGFPPAPAAQYRRILTREVQFYWGLAQEQAPFFGQVHQESRWVATAQSRFAGGLGQFTPATAETVQRWYSADLKALCAGAGGCPYEPAWALRALVLYDRRLWTSAVYASMPVDRYAFMLAAYNGGLGWINRERAVCTPPTCDAMRYFQHVEFQCGRSVPARSKESCSENRQYPAVILKRWGPLYAQWLRLGG